MNKKVTLLVPCYNEEQALPIFYQEINKFIAPLSQYEWEILLVNDGSRDNTAQIIKSLHATDKRVQYVDLSRNFGKEAAMLAGFDYATGDCMILMDADLQDPPEIIPQMLKYWEEGYHDVYARRKDRGEESWLKKKFTLLFYHLLKKSVSRFEILENVGDFRLLDRKCIDALKQLREGERYTKGLFCWIGFDKKEIVFDRKERVAGSTHWSFWNLSVLAINGFTSFSILPLRLATCVGFGVSVVAITLLLWYGLKALIIGDTTHGFPTLIVSILFLGGVQLLSLGIIGEYLGKTYTESKHRPAYLVKDDTYTTKK